MRRLALGGMLLVLGLVNASAQQARPQPPGDGVQVAVPRGSASDAARDASADRKTADARKKLASLPVPRTADGHVILGQTATQKGVWLPGPVIPNPLGMTDVPYQDWTRALAAERNVNRLEPHTRCKPSGVVRQFLTPYGVEMLELRDVQRVYIFDIGGPHTYRTVYLDGRAHPKQPQADFYGHSIGHWDGDTLVVDSVGFNEDFWMDRAMLPHTSQLHTIERFTRTSFDTMRYELTIDDPGAYTAPFSGKMDLHWEKDTELFEYVCQQENYAPTLMVGEGTKVDRTSPIVP